MNYIELLNADLIKGYSKSDLEMLIGLPKNSLSGVIKGDKKLSKISQLKIKEWEASNKPNPLKVLEMKREMALAKLKLTAPPNPSSILIDIQDLNKQTNKIEPQKPLGSEKSNFTVTNIPPMPQREDYTDSIDFSIAKAEWKRKYNQ